MTASPFVEIARILIEFEIERQQKTADSPVPWQDSESAAVTHQPKAGERSHDTVSRRSVKNQEAQHDH
jgi:hypothetical protein